MRKGRLLAALLVLTATATDHARSAGAPVPSLTLAPCASEGAMKGAWWGSLPVPEDPNQPGGRTIDLRVVVPFDLDQWIHGECLDAVMLGFYEHPGTIETDCLRGMKPPSFR